MPSPSKSSTQAATPSRQPTPRRQLLSTTSTTDETSGGQQQAASGADLIFAPQVSKESKLSVYDLDDECETGKADSVQVFDLGESSSDDKLPGGKPNKAGQATKVNIFFNSIFYFHYIN